MSIRATDGGRFDRTRKHIYFPAAGGGPLEYASKLSEHLLIAVNELEAPSAISMLDYLIDQDRKVLLDSGVFALAMEHAKRHGMTHDDALNLAPAEVDGFDHLFEHYVKLVTRWRDRLWGYIEIDFGGADNKRKTRALLESMGFAPIPVYHPLADGWDYFDELAEQYDRICLGNIVQAERATRLRLLATVMERKRKYPHLWVHALGLTPNEMIYAFPIESADSSSWLHGVRWGAPPDRAAGKSMGKVPDDFKYRLGADVYGDDGHHKGWTFGIYLSLIQTQNWRSHIAKLEAEGLHP